MTILIKAKSTHNVVVLIFVSKMQNCQNRVSDIDSFLNRTVFLPKHSQPKGRVALQNPWFSYLIIRQWYYNITL